MHIPKKKEDALEEYPITLQMKFKTQNDLENFIAAFLDGGGEQHSGCYTESVTEDGTWNGKTKDGYTKSSWHWDEPMMFLNVDEMEEYE